MIFVIQTNDEVAGLDIDRALSLAGISCTIISKTRDEAIQRTAQQNRKYMIFVIQTNDEVAGLDIDRALSLAGISCTIISKTRDEAVQQSVQRMGLLARISKWFTESR